MRDRTLWVRQVQGKALVVDGEGPFNPISVARPKKQQGRFRLSVPPSVPGTGSASFRFKSPELVDPPVNSQTFNCAREEGESNLRERRTDRRFSCEAGSRWFGTRL